MNTTHRNYALDFLKFIAAIFITNSHFIPVYKDINVGLATLGVHGNALFFFVSGYLLLGGLERHEMKFGNWFKRRVQRLWPAVFLWALIASMVWDDTLDWQKVIIAPKYWFLQCIVIYYALYYPVCKQMLKSGAVYMGCSNIFCVMCAVFTKGKWLFVSHVMALCLSFQCYDLRRIGVSA